MESSVRSGFLDSSGSTTPISNGKGRVVDCGRSWFMGCKPAPKPPTTAHPQTPNAHVGHEAVKLCLHPVTLANFTVLLPPRRVEQHQNDTPMTKESSAGAFEAGDIEALRVPFRGELQTCHSVFTHVCSGLGVDREDAVSRLKAALKLLLSVPPRPGRETRWASITPMAAYFALWALLGGLGMASVKKTFIQPAEVQEAVLQDMVTEVDLKVVYQARLRKVRSPLRVVKQTEHG